VINRLTGVRYALWADVPAPKIGSLAGRVATHRLTLRLRLD
jgi:hypothetical protein